MYYPKYHHRVYYKYRDPYCIKHIRLNTGVYISNGGGSSCYIKVPKLNASTKIWRNFYEMFPFFKELLQAENYVTKSGNWALVRLKPHWHNSKSVVKIRTDIL